MTRRLLLALSTLLARAAAGGPAEPWDEWNAYVAQANEWARLRNTRLKDPARARTFDAAEFQEWQRVKSMGKQAVKAIDREYQER